jgi:hypothetical protein
MGKWRAPNYRLRGLEEPHGRQPGPCGEKGGCQARFAVPMCFPQSHDFAQIADVRVGW